jgi:hypothetical protein
MKTTKIYTANGSVQIEPKGSLPFSPVRNVNITLTFEDGTTLGATVEDLLGIVQEDI